jgi:hypothetical protein
VADTGEGRGRGLNHCHAMMKEMELNPMLPSNCFHGSRVCASNAKGGVG